MARGIDKIRVVIFRRKEGTWILGIGSIPFLLLTAKTLLGKLGILDSSPEDLYLSLWGILGIIVSLSAYLARQFAHTNRDLEIQLAQVKELTVQKLEQERQIREEEVRRKLTEEATRRKSEFLSRMSHDLRTPMTAIIGYTRILLRKARDTLDPRQLRNLENIQTSAHNLLSLINEILDLSRVEAGRIEIRPQSVDLQQLAEECAAAVEPLLGANVRLVQEIEAAPSLHTDPEILRKVLMNLLSNAVKFTDAGSITVSVKPVDDQVEVSVADTGIGIPAADLPYIFEEFRQVARQGNTAKEGTGLGLAIARKSVELLGGTISADSEVGAGTTFTLKIKDYRPE